MNITRNRAATAAFAAAGLLGLLALAACDTAPPTHEGKVEMRHDSNYALAQAVRNDPSLSPLLSSAAGYAVFPSIGKGAIGIGGAYGKGDVYANGAVVGYCDLGRGGLALLLLGCRKEALVAQTSLNKSIFKESYHA